MNEEIEVHETNVEIFYITDDEELFMEVSEKDFFLSDYETVIDLSKPIVIDTLKVSSPEGEIIFPNQLVFDTFLEIFKERKKP